MRTIPPYLAALLASWLAVYSARHEPFDIGYLFFVQNYYRRIPFFLVSWSLCVEEHFYLLVPLVLFIFGNFTYRRRNVLVFAVTLLAAPMFRLFAFPHVSDQFGYAITATHLHMDGLILGVFLSYMATESPKDFRILTRTSPYIVAASVVGMAILLLDDSGALTYVLRGTMVAVFFSAVLVFAISRPEISGRFATIFFPIALTSYSAYLTHPLALHATDEIMRRLSDDASMLYFTIAIVLIAASSASFYFAFEWTSICVRDFYWPRRTPDQEYLDVLAKVRKRPMPDLRG